MYTLATALHLINAVKKSLIKGIIPLRLQYWGLCCGLGAEAKVYRIKAGTSKALPTAVLRRYL